MLHINTVCTVNNNNIEQIQQIVDEMSKCEKERLITEPFEKMWKHYIQFMID
jgi:hypothetical protein